MSHSPPVPQGNQSPYPRTGQPVAPAIDLPPILTGGTGDSVVKEASGLPLGLIAGAVGVGAAVLGGVLLATLSGDKRTDD